MAEYSTSANAVQTSQSIAINGVAASSPVAVTATPAASTNLVGGLLGGVLHLLFNKPPTTSYNPAHNVQAAEGAITGTLNAADPDGDPLTFTVTQAPQHGTVVVNAPAGTFTYTPDPAFAHLGGTDTFTVRVSDNHPTLLSPAGVITKTVSVTVSPVNHAPAVGDPAYTVVTVNPNNGVITGTVNVTDQDSDPLTYSLSTPPDPAKGAVVVDPTTGNWTYTPTLNARFKATDINATPADQQVSFTISASDGFTTAPVAVTAPVQKLAITTIGVGDFPDGVAVTPDGSRVYVTNQAEASVSVIDAATNTVIATIPVGSAPGGVAVTPNGSRVYVANGNSATVSVIDAASNTVITPIDLTPNGVEFPIDVATSPDGGRVYVGDFSGGVAVIDTATNTVVTTFGAGTNASGLAVSPDGSRLYVSDFEDNTVTVFETATYTVVATIPVPASGAAADIAVSPDGSRVYVVADEVRVIDTATNTVITTIDLPSPADVAVSPDGTRLFVTNFLSDSVSVVDTATNTVIATIPAGASSSPTELTISPDGTRAYVTGFGPDATLAVITLA